MINASINLIINLIINQMKSIKLLTAFLVLLFCANVSLAQSLRVQGTVRDSETGETIPFAYVQIKGTTTGTQTDMDGRYTIETPANATLVYIFTGYVTKEEAVNSRSLIDVILEPEAEKLDDVMVVAYGTAKKESFTGSAEVITSEKLEKRTVANVTKALDGMATGVISTSGSGQPGSGASVIIRGFGSISASTSPLYVVDGIPYDGQLNAINPNDIESMTIIKDASAGALYGARGANGVVMITTKRGKEGTLNVQLKANWSIASRAIPRYRTMDSYQWTEDLYGYYLRESFASGNTGGALAAEAMESFVKSNVWAGGRYNPFSRELADLIDPATGKIKEGTTLKWDEDWLDESMADNPLRQEYVLSVNGGTGRTNYMFSLGFLDQNGLVISTKFTRYSARANVDTKIKEWFKAGLNTNFANSKTNSTVLGSSGSSSAYSNVFYTAQNMGPIYPMYEKDANGQTVYDINGNPKYDWGNDRPAGASPGWNPIANLYEDKYESLTDNLSARSYVEFGGLADGAIRGLKFTVNFGFDYTNSRSTTFYNPDFGNGVTVKGLLANGNSRLFSYTFNQLLTYNRDFGKHNIDVLLGHEYYDYNYRYLSAQKSGQAVGGIFELNGFATLQDASGYSNDYRIDSYIGRVNYGFDNRYYLSASYRRDASSIFHKDNRWGDFWSVGASWRISQENFLKNVRWLNNLTIKASYGVQGNDQIGSLYAWQAYYSISYPNSNMSGSVVSKLETKDLQWEKNGNFNVGVEGRLFDRLSASLEYYNRKTEDMLMSYPLAMSLGFESYNKNIGSMRNSGFEFTLSGDIIKKDKFNWNMTVMGSTVSNKILKLTEDGEPIVGSSSIIKEGEELNSFYLPMGAGVDPATGDKLYLTWTEDEQTGEKTYSTTTNQSTAQNYREVCGSRIPDLYGSINNQFRIGNFDISLFCTYSIGGKMLDGLYYEFLYNTYPGTAAHVDRQKAWKQPGDITSIPRIDISGRNKISYTADNLISASYFAIKSFSVGYSLPEKWMRAINMKSIRFTLSGDNLLLLSARRGMDPQYNFTGSVGYSYTPERTVSFGVDINF